MRFRDEAMQSADGSRLKVPHMGWSRGAAGARRIRCGRASTTARASISHTATIRYPTTPALTAGTVAYPAPFTCAIARANIFATQFHPEKSHTAGLRLLANFVAWNGRS